MRHESNHRTTCMAVQIFVFRHYIVSLDFKRVYIEIIGMDERMRLNGEARFVLKCDRDVAMY